MTYDETRDSEQLNVHQPLIEDFISRFQAPHPPSPCPRQTVFFFPGGMASQLKRSRERFQDGVANQVFNYDTLWLNADSLLGGARPLRMYKHSPGVWRDQDDHIVIADGAVNFFGCTPHDDFIAWCPNNNVDLYVFNWDWRRRLDETVNFFVGKFLPFFRAQVLDAGGPDPLANFSLVGHSFGGMIVNLVLRGNDPIVANMASAITVATPFYGYSGQVHRWFEGEALLNGPFDFFKKEMIEVISSFASLYTLHFLDVATYNANLPGLPNDPNFPLNAYPSMDATTAGLRADPYYPQTNGSLVRYPGNLGFDPDELNYGWHQFLQMNHPILDPALANKFYNIQGVCTQSDQQTPLTETVGSVTWDWIPSNFNCHDPSPITDIGLVPGDNTQPAWTTRLLTNAPLRCIVVKGDDLEHMFLMNSSQTLSALASILCPVGAPMKRLAKAKRARRKPVPPDDVQEFLRWLYKYKWERNWAPINDAEMLDAVPRELQGNLANIARSIMTNILKRPPPWRPAPQLDAPDASSLRPAAPRDGKRKIAKPRNRATKAALHPVPRKAGKK